MLTLYSGVHSLWLWTPAWVMYLLLVLLLAVIVRGMASAVRVQKSQTPRATYDKENQVPVLHCSICNGEQVAGFRDIRTGKFEEIALIRNEEELQAFMKQYGISKMTKEY